MSAALPWLQKLRKPQLTDWAEATDLHDYEELNKPELAVALDEHLQAHQSIFASDARLAEYYRRLTQTPRKGSPIKREPKVEVTPLAPRSARRRQTRAKEEELSESASREDKPKEEAKEKAELTYRDESSESPPPVFETPGRPSLNFEQALPASPAVVANAIDRGASAFGNCVGSFWTRLGVEERRNEVRSILSSVKAVQVLFLLLEGACLIYETMPMRFVTTIPLFIDPLVEIPVKVPDVFILVDGAFWAPFSLWLFTSIILPLTAAYFFNISLNIAQGSGGARRSRAAQANFDPLSYNIAKAGLAYLVYAKQFDFWDLYSRLSIAKVNAALPGQWAGLVTGSAIGLIGTLYEAILRK